jgi:uncharacterized phage protein (TIGR02220 family)
MGEVVALPKDSHPSLIEQASLVIDFLNSRTGRKFPARNPKGAPTSNAEFVIGRLREGYTMQDCKSVIAAKVREWMHDDKMNRYLTPETLFRRSNFERYIGSIGGADEVS